MDGTPYQWGGLAEGEAFDCSGLIAHVLDAVDDDREGRG